VFCDCDCDLGHVILFYTLPYIVSLKKRNINIDLAVLPSHDKYLISSL